MRVLAVLAVLVVVINAFDNDEKCHNGGETRHGKCGCPYYFKGEFCDDPVCANNGALSADGKSCACPEGFTGTACQFPSCSTKVDSTVSNDGKSLVLMVEVSTSTRDAIQGLADNIDAIFNEANAAHKQWLTSIIIYAMNVNGLSSSQQFFSSSDAKNFLKDLTQQAVYAGQCSMYIWEALDDLYSNFNTQLSRSPLVLITAAIPQVNGTDVGYAMKHFTTEAPTFDVIHVENSACPMAKFKQNHTEFVNFAVSFNGVFLRSSAADVGNILRSHLPTRYVAQRISVSPHLPDINCASDSINVRVDSQTSQVYVTVAGAGATVVVRDPSNNVVSAKVVISSSVQSVVTFAPKVAGQYNVIISSNDDMCFPVVYSDGIQVVLAFTEHYNSDQVLYFPLRVFDNFPVAKQYGRGDVLGTLDYIYTRKYYIEPATWWHVTLQSPMVSHNNCGFPFIGEDFDKLLDDLTTFTVQGTDKHGMKFERSISAFSHFNN